MHSMSVTKETAGHQQQSPPTKLQLSPRMWRPGVSRKNHHLSCRPYSETRLSHTHTHTHTTLCLCLHTHYTHFAGCGSRFPLDSVSLSPAGLLAGETYELVWQWWCWWGGGCGGVQYSQWEPSTELHLCPGQEEHTSAFFVLCICMGLQLYMNWEECCSVGSRQSKLGPFSGYSLGGVDEPPSAVKLEPVADVFS